LALQAGDLDKAAQALEAAKRQVQDSPLVGLALRTTEAQLLMARGDTEGARSLLQSAMAERELSQRSELSTDQHLLLAKIAVLEGDREEASRVLIEASPLIRDFESRKLAQDLERVLGTQISATPTDVLLEGSTSNLVDAVTSAARIAPPRPSKWRTRMNWTFVGLYGALLVAALLINLGVGVPDSMQSSPFWAFMVGGSLLVAVAITVLGRTDRGRSLVSLAGLGCLSFSGLCIGALVMIFVFGGVLRLSGDHLVPFIFLGALVGMILPPIIVLRRGGRPVID
jgi:hypothetical protein